MTNVALASIIDADHSSTPSGRTETTGKQDPRSALVDQVDSLSNLKLYR
jgi:hypothetical protein